MTNRNLSPLKMFFEMATNRVPTNKFSAKTKEEFDKWKADTYPKAMACLGDYPAKVPLNPELIVEWDEDGIIKRKYLIDVGPYISAKIQIHIPKDIKPGEKRAAINCWHGHGLFGKEPIMGNIYSDTVAADVRNMNYIYGLEMAKAGFITYAIDWIGAGDRSDSNKPHYHDNSGRDWCNALYLHATMLGMTSLSINLMHGMAATDFVCTFPEVDENKLGVMGLSGGGTMTLWTALHDPRIKATEIICYSDLWAYFGIRDNNYCGMQVAPGLFKLLDLPDLQGLIAPRPLLIDIGIHDKCFFIDTAIECYKQLENIYKVAGASDKLELDLFPTNHAWGGKSVDFFRKYL